MLILCLFECRRARNRQAAASARRRREDNNAALECANLEQLEQFAVPVAEVADQTRINCELEHGMHQRVVDIFAAGPSEETQTDETDETAGQDEQADDKSPTSSP